MPDGVTVVAELYYEDPETALDWLSKAFGFETRLLVKDEHKKLIFSESGYGDCTVAILPEQTELNRSPLSAGGTNTQTVRIRTSMDVREHCKQARASGATIIKEPEQFFFGDLTYFVADLEGHIWTFAQSIEGTASNPPEGWTITFPSRDLNAS